MSESGLAQESWSMPQVFELSVGQSCCVATPGGSRTVKLLRVEHAWESDYWIVDNPEHRTLRRADVTVEVDGQSAVLVARAFQPPVEVHGLRLYVETTRPWTAGIRGVDDLHGDVRLSAVPAGHGWGPSDMLFPIRDFRWRSSTYSNSWASLVPYNKLYYHRGEDYGAIPDRLGIQCPLAGEVVSTPLPTGDGLSNGLSVRSADAIEMRMAHMNIETIDPLLLVGTSVERGQVLARTGCTWNGRQGQKNDPHLHLGFQVCGQTVSTYPYMIEAYFRTYPDPILPIAGGFYFAEPGQTIELDGGRSLARSGRRIVSHTWRLHDGTIVDGPIARMQCDRPGLYSEQLTVRDDAGNEDHDFAQVRVYDASRGRDMAFGWAYHSPVRGIRPGTEVLFWPRLVKRTAPVSIDFGDGSPAQATEADITHRYERPGVYVVTFVTTGPADEPATVQLRVVVES